MSPRSMHDPPRFEYFRGYPGRFRRDRRRVVRIALIWPGMIFLTSLAGVAASTFTISVCALQALPETHFPQYAAGELFGAICLLLPLTILACWSGWGLWEILHVARATTIVPYFRRELGDIHTFAQG